MARDSGIQADGGENHCCKDADDDRVGDEDSAIAEAAQNARHEGLDAHRTNRLGRTSSPGWMGVKPRPTW